MIGIRDTVSKVILLLLALWIGLSFIRTVYNLSKLLTEEPRWYFLSDEQKRALQFGDLHDFFRFIQTKIASNSNVLFYTDSGEAYYLARYYLYPTKVIWGEHLDDFPMSEKSNFNYVVTYAISTVKINDTVLSTRQLQYKKIAAFKGREGEVGLIYGL